MRHRALIVIATALILSALLIPVYAHANLIRSDPPANSILGKSPSQVTLYFTEQLEPKLSGASILDSTGREVDTGYSVNPTDPTILIVSLPVLQEGVYTVSWHAISAVDGHHTSGSFSFGVGNVTIPTQSSASQSYTPPSLLEVTERWLNLLADVLFLGAGIFTLLVWNPALLTLRGRRFEEYSGKVSKRVSKILLASAILAIGATLLLLVVEAIAASVTPAIEDVVATAFTIITSTELGEYWIIRFVTTIAAVCASIILARSEVTSKRNWLLTLTVGLALSLTTSISSHNAASTEYLPVVNLLSDWIHLIGVAAWIGGLTYVVVAVTSNSHAVTEKRKLATELIRRFSPIAVVSVGAIGITGVYNLVLEVGSLTALFTTTYGQIILAKLIIFASMVSFGALNQMVLFDHMVGRTGENSQSNRHETGRWLGRFSLSIRTEMALGIVLLLVVGLLTASAPVAQTPSSAPRYQPSPFVVHGYSSDGINVTLSIFPYQAGVNHFRIDFTDPQGTPVSSIRSVFLKFQYLERNIGVSIANASSSANKGQFTVDGTFLSFAGAWRAEVWAQRTGGFDIVVPFQLDVPAISLRYAELPLSNDANPYGITVDQNGTVWFAESGSGNLAHYDPNSGAFNEFQLPQGGSRPFYVTVGKNEVWVTETQYNTISMFNPSTSTFEHFTIPSPGAVPGGITLDKNGDVWFTEEIANKIGRLNPSTGNITEFPIPTQDAIPIQITTDLAGNLWFTESKAGKIGMINPRDGTISEFAPENNTLLGPTGITSAPDGSVWFTEHAGNRITHFTSQNQTFRAYPIPTAQAFPFGIAYHNGRIWFVEHIANAIGNLDPVTGTFSNFPVPNNSSDVQLLSVDQSGNVWFTLPASNILGALTPTTSLLQLTPNTNNTPFTQLALVAALVIAASSLVAFIMGRKRMDRKMVQGHSPRRLRR